MVSLPRQEEGFQQDEITFRDGSHVQMEIKKCADIELYPETVTVAGCVLS